MSKLFLDFESYSDLDIKQVGAYRYAMHPSTEVLMAAYAIDHGPVKLWVPAEGEEVPDDLVQAIAHAEIHAFNAPFERLILKYVLRARIPISRFRCTMIQAWQLSFSGDLAEIGRQLGLPADKRKQDRGRRLIQKFCKPQPKNHKIRRHTHETAPEEWEEFKQYCIQDVIAEREIELLLAHYPMPQRELELWFWDQAVNDRGVPVDRALVDAAVEMEHQEKARLTHEMMLITGLENPNSNPQLMGWLNQYGLGLENMQAETLEALLASPRTGYPRHVVEMKLLVSQTSTTKWRAFQRALCDDDRLRGMFTFAGAQRTQRWAGRLVQLHNLKSPEPEYENTITSLVDVLLTRDLDLLHALFNNVMDVLSQGIRCAITAPEGKVLIPCDLSSIESRVLGYLSGCQRINWIFETGKDTYKDFASELFHVPYDEVTKPQRKFSKPPVLGCGYGLGAGDPEDEEGGLIDYAAGMGVTMTYKEAKHAVDLWRELHPEVPQMWYAIAEACQDAVLNHTEFTGFGVRIRRDQNFLIIDLPSGRSIYYYQPLVLMKVPPWERKKPVEEQRKKPTLTYMGMNQYTHKWERITTAPGKIVENIVQALSRDVLGWHMLKIEADIGPGIVAHVHDEAVLEWDMDDDKATLDTLEEIMSQSPPWAPTLKLGAKGFITRRYTKG